MRKFESGATRDTVEGKFDLEGFLSPAVLNRYAEYMNKHRKQADGKLRDSDNWQKGIPLDVYMKSAYRHFFDLWANHRHVESAIKEDIEESLCALLFNTMGYLHEYLKDKAGEYNAAEIDGPYVPQPGDVVFIEMRDDSTDKDHGYPGLADTLQQYNFIGTIVQDVDGQGVLLYGVVVGSQMYNLYPDELTVLKRKGM